MKKMKSVIVLVAVGLVIVLVVAFWHRGASVDQNPKDTSPRSKALIPVAKQQTKPESAQDVAVADKCGSDKEDAQSKKTDKPAKPGVSSVQPKISMADANLTPELLKSLREIFQKGMDPKVSDGHFLQELSCYRPSTVLAAATAVMRFGTSKEKQNALWAVGMLFSTETQHVVDAGVAEAGAENQQQVNVDVSKAGDEIPAVDTEDAAAAQNQSVAEEQANRTCGVVNAVSAGLEDSDADVRAAAFDVMRALPADEGGILNSQVLNGKDVEMKSRLLEAVSGSRSDVDVRASLMGMGAAESEIRQMAADNLKAVSGQSFSSQDDAAKWYDSHHQEFQQDAGNVEAHAQ